MMIRIYIAIMYIHVFMRLSPFLTLIKYEVKFLDECEF